MHALLVLLALAAAPPQPSADVSLILVRHAEPSTAPSEDPGLSDEGRTRVQCLAALLKDEKITHVVSSPWRRARETAGPLAAEHQLESLVRDPMDAKALATELGSLPQGSVVLVVGHTNTLPLLVTALGGGLSGLVDERGQPSIPRDDFDRIVRITLHRESDGTARIASLVEGREGCDPPRN